MTPSTIRLISQLRQEFYTLFSSAMEGAVHITSGNSSTSNPSLALWLDNRQCLNYLYLYAYTAPDDLIPERPFVLRLAINKNVGTPTLVGPGRGSRGLNRNWHFELTLLPREIMDFLPWIVDLVQSYDSNSAFLIPNPPYPLHFKTSPASLFHNAQTYGAGNELAHLGRYIMS